jgi:holo-[acyl-carrier protein] synthase
MAGDERSGPRRDPVTDDARTPGAAAATESVAVLAGPPEGTTELGIDIIKVTRIAETLGRFGDRFSQRVLTAREQRYVRGRPETFAGRWAAKEAVSKVLGLGVRGIGWRDIEVERLPTGQPAVRLHGRAAARADQLGMTRIALSISHEADYAVAIAFGVRATGGRYVFPLDIEDHLDERERRVLARMDRLRRLSEGARPDPDGRHTAPEGSRPVPSGLRPVPGSPGRPEPHDA